MVQGQANPGLAGLGNDSRDDPTFLGCCGAALRQACPGIVTYTKLPQFPHLPTIRHMDLDLEHLQCNNKKSSYDRREHAHPGAMEALTTVGFAGMAGPWHDAAAFNKQQGRCASTVSTASAAVVMP